MKKIVLGIICLLPVVSAAQSTCEKRVDAHQKATTLQRVSYCLTPDYSAPDNANAGLVFSGVSVREPQAQPQTAQRVTAREGYFKPQEVSIAQTYVDTKQFPQLQQEGKTQPLTVADTAVTVQETQAFTYVPSPTVEAPATVVSVPTKKPVEHFMADEVNASGKLIPRTHTVASVSETKAGVKARQTKPTRQWVTAPAPAVQEVPQQPTVTAQPNTYEEDLTQPAGQTEIPVGSQSYAPATSSTEGLYEEIPAGTQSYAPATAN